LKKYWVIAAFAPASTFALEVQQVLAVVAGLGMGFRIGRHLDLEPVAGFLADETHQFVGVAEFTRLGHAGGQVAAQGDDVADAVGAVGFQDFPQAAPGRAHAGKVGRGGESRRPGFPARFPGCGPGSSHRAPKVTEKNFGLSWASWRRVARSLAMPSGVLGGKNSMLKVRSAMWGVNRG
jgi:hypothetical protein